jgi:glycosyl transferase family 2
MTSSNSPLVLMGQEYVGLPKTGDDSGAGGEKLWPGTAAPLVSVLIPAFNQERFIARTLDSVLVDGYPNIEVIILDDGSWDATGQVARAWVSQYGRRIAGGIRLLEQENCGLVKTLNRLLSEARGEFITLLAADDCLCPESIGARVDYLLSRPRYLAVFGDAAGIDDNDNLLYESVLQNRYFASLEALCCDRTRGLELILNWSVPGPVYLARRSVTYEIGSYDERYCFEDRNYYLRLINANALGFINRRVALYRMREEPRQSRFSQIAPDFDRIHQDILPEFHGLKRVAVGIHVAAKRMKSRDDETIVTWVALRLLIRLRKRMIWCNRRVATFLAALHGPVGGQPGSPSAYGVDDCIE